MNQEGGGGRVYPGERVWNNASGHTLKLRLVWEPEEWSDDNNGVIFHENNDRIRERVLQRTRAVVVHF